VYHFDAETRLFYVDRKKCTSAETGECNNPPHSSSFIFPDCSSSSHPRPDLGVGSIWIKIKWRMVQRFSAAAPAFSVGSSEAVLRDIPSAMWWAPTIQGVEELQQRCTIDSYDSSSSSGSRGCLYNFHFILGLSISLEN
jgi:hypothetical protein